MVKTELAYRDAAGAIRAKLTLQTCEYDGLGRRIITTTDHGSTLDGTRFCLTAGLFGARSGCAG